MTDTTTEPRRAPMPGHVLELPIDTVSPDPDNPRRELADLEGLAASIAEVGILQPITVRPGDELGGYVIVYGHRRHAAARLAGQMTIPAILRTTEPDDVLVAQLVENLHREDLTPLDEARAFLRLTKELGLTQDAAAQRAGRSKAHVSKRLALLVLPAEAQRALLAGHLSLATAVDLTQLAKHKAQLRAVVDELEAAVASDLADVEEGKTPAWPTDKRVASEIATQRRHVEEHERRKASKAEAVRLELELVDRWYDGEGKHRKAVKADTATHGWIDYSGGLVKLVALPKAERAAKKATAEASDGAKRIAAARAHLEELHQRRVEICRQIVTAGGLEHAALALLLDVYGFVREDPAVRELLKIEANRTLEAYIAASPTGARRAIVASVLAAAELELADLGELYDYLGAPVEAGSARDYLRRHYALLVAHGYDLDPVEVTYLGVAP